MDNSQSKLVKDDKKRRIPEIVKIEEKEKCCASSLKKIHKSKTQHSLLKTKLEAVCLEELGDIYLEKSKLTHSGRDYTKSAGLYNAAMVRYSEEIQREKVKKKLSNLVKAFVEIELEHSCEQDRVKYALDVNRNKLSLQELRDFCKQELVNITIKYPAYEDGNFEKINEMTEERKKLEADRAGAIEQLYLNISARIKSLVGQLLDQCLEVMDQPPCKYALIGLGSLARDLATPYSDLESAILIEEDSEEHKNYFGLLSYFLHIKVIDLGETIIPALAINSLNDFIGKNDWFYDSETPRGFSFDGSMPWASKTPMGREATPKKPKPVGLIETPFHLANLLTEETASKEGYHLADILSDATLIKGDCELVDQFKHHSHQILSKSSDKVAGSTINETISVQQARGYSNLLAGFKEFNILSTLQDPIHGKSYNVKKEIFRFPTIMLSSLSWIYNTTSSNLWNAIRELYKRKEINLDAKHNLHVIISLVAELRLASYMKHGRQKEELVVREFGSSSGRILSSNQQKLIRYYLTALPFQDTIENYLLGLSSNQNKLFRYYNIHSTVLLVKGAIESVLKYTTNRNLAFKLQNNNFYQCTHNYKGKIYVRLAMYNEAEISYKSVFEDGEKENPELYLDLALLEIQLGKLEDAKNYINAYSDKYPRNNETRVPEYLGHIYSDLGEYDKAVEYYQKQLTMSKIIIGENVSNPFIADSLQNLGNACFDKGENNKAVDYHQESLAMKRKMSGKDSVHPSIAASFRNLGHVSIKKGDCDKGIEYYCTSLAMMKQIYGEHAANENIAASISSLGNAWQHKQDYDKAVEFYQESLAMEKQIRGLDMAHPDIATLLNDIGVAWYNKGAYDKAVEYYQESLTMQKQIYGLDVAHTDIARSLNNIGNVCYRKGDYDKAVEFHQESLAMEKQIHGQDVAHPDIARSLMNLGSTWLSKGDYDKAVEYHQESLDMKKQIHGQDVAHPDIAESLSNIGNTWLSKGDYNKAVEYHQESLTMEKQIHGQDAAHPDIAASLINLGKAWKNKGDYDKAIEHYQESLDMKKQIYGQDAAHPDIAGSLSNLGNAWHHKHDYDKAVEYGQESLDMQKEIYGQDAARPDIAGSLSNLGNAWYHKHDYDKAVEYGQESLDMQKEIYGQDAAHPDIARSLLNLGIAWSSKGDHDKAVEYYQESLAMNIQIHGQDVAHPDIARLLTGLGNAW